MNYKIVAPSSLPENVIVQLPASKSLSNRALILDALSGFKSRIINLSKANDTKVLQRILNHKDGLLDVEDAGTALRFAAVYFSLMDGEHVIIGTERLMKRPMQPLLDALKRLGGKAVYKTSNGKTVLAVHGGKLKGGDVSVDASLSSQFISALLLCGAAMKNGLVVSVDGKTVSQPYIDMTLGLMSQVGIDYKRNKKTIFIPHQEVNPFKLKIENDWSSASYFYVLLASYDRGEMLLKDLAMESLQGDAIVMDLMEIFGVKSIAVKEENHDSKEKIKAAKVNRC